MQPADFYSINSSPIIKLLYDAAAKEQTEKKLDTSGKLKLTQEAERLSVLRKYIFHKDLEGPALEKIKTIYDGIITDLNSLNQDQLKLLAEWVASNSGESSGIYKTLHHLFVAIAEFNGCPDAFAPEAQRNNVDTRLKTLIDFDTTAKGYLEKGKSPIPENEDVLSVIEANLDPKSINELARTSHLYQNMEKANLVRRFNAGQVQVKDLVPAKFDSINAFIQYLGTESCSKILRLNLSGCVIPDDNFTFLENFKNLKNLNLSECRITDIAFLEKFPKLKALNCSYTNISDISHLKNCRDLEVLKLDGCYDIENFNDLSELKKLQHLSLCDLELTDLEFIIKVTSPIKKLDLSNCQVLTNIQGLQSFGELEELSLSNCNVEDYSVLSKLPSLKYVYIELSDPVMPSELKIGLEEKGVELKTFGTAEKKLF